ncbi:hypothetical protein [Actinomadura sp. 3N508]|uniref:hypothetical protein n=1 Tax=Actinomadura sp. 3N508 TaxID=3375153 RepID=UPI0037A27C1B
MEGVPDRPVRRSSRSPLADLTGRRARQRAELIRRTPALQAGALITLYSDPALGDVLDSPDRMRQDLDRAIVTACRDLGAWPGTPTAAPE